MSVLLSALLPVARAIAEHFRIAFYFGPISAGTVRLFLNIFLSHSMSFKVLLNLECLSALEDTVM